jgi:hypothetical protein
MYGGDVFYRIKRGETNSALQAIDNDEAGRLLLAFDLKQPWTCHQSYKILDELHAEIFARPEVTAPRIVAVTDLHTAIIDCLDEVESQMLSSYRLTQYFLLFLLRQALEVDETGKAFCASPEPFITEDNGRSRIGICAQRIVKDIIIDLNAEVKEREDAGNPFDYKRELKSPNAVREFSRSVIPQYQKAVSRGRACSFEREWKRSGKKKGKD